jgi:hypothetical protein
MVETIWASLRLRTQRRLATTRSTG